MARMPGSPRLGRPISRTVDTARERSVSFAPPETRTSPRQSTLRQPIPVGPGRPPTVVPPRSGIVPDEVERFPIQLGKVQPPVLRDETLERPRLLDWLRAKIHGRVVLLLADAGYGKTTLLADFSRRTRLRTLWYRLDDDDRDWVTLLGHLVASGREHDPDFAPRTSDLLARTGIGGPGREEVLDSFIAELPSIAVNGAMLILDDFHLVDDAIDARHVVRELLARAPERFTLVFASRRMPTVPLARLRSIGDVAELGTDDLRFDVAETTRLFNETFGRDMDEDVLVDLTRRTEGWIASLQLVQAALRDRSQSEIRRFVRGLTGGDHELYDYLAEEVVGDLSEELQRFLMETALLQIVTPDLAGVATDLGGADVTRLTTSAEALTLLTRMSGSPRTHRRYHPLVREFLEARLRSLDGSAAVAERHRRIAATAAAYDWRIAAYHYREAGDIETMLEVIGEAIPSIMGNGQYALAESFIGSIPPDRRPARFDLILSRVDMQQGDTQSAIDASLAALEAAASDPVQRDHALLNLVTLYLNYGDGDRAIEYADQLRASTDPNLAMIAEASVAMVTGSESDDIDRINRLLISMAKAQRADRPHHFAVTQYNLASNYVLQDRPDAAIELLSSAVEILQSGSAAIELDAGILLRAHALAMLGRSGEAMAQIGRLQADAGHHEDEVAIGIAELVDSFLDPESAPELFVGIEEAHELTPSGARLFALSAARMLSRRDRHVEAEAMLARYPAGRPAHLGIEAARELTRAYLATARHDPAALELAEGARRHARRQSAHRWRLCADVLTGLAATDQEFSRQLTSVGRTSPQTLTFIADVLAENLDRLAPEAVGVLESAAVLHPQRWRVELRGVIDRRERATVACARVLEKIGDRSDIKRLRLVARDSRKRPDVSVLGRRLARRLADQVLIEDQGRVWFRVGDREVPGSEVRRKVLALTCFLVTRPQMSSTRDQVLDTLWPDLDPETAANSLNQTIYFLRRVIEEQYVEDLSPGYIHHDSDVIWLDPELVTSRSIECRSLIGSFAKEPTPDEVDSLLDMYHGRFALDFEYEEWSAAHRDSLHAAYLDVVERSLREDVRTGHHSRGIRVARRALEIDSSAEEIEVALLRLYSVIGAHAAAAEQYGHYANVMRDELGIDPPPLESL